MPGDVTFKTESMLHLERRNFLLNNIRAYFFGASLEDSLGEVKTLYDRAKEEQTALEKSEKDPDVKRQITQDKNVLESRYNAFKELTEKLKVENPASEGDYITDQDLEVFRQDKISTLFIKDRPKKGVNETILSSFLSDIRGSVGVRSEYEADNHYNVPFANQMLRKSWLEQIQKHMDTLPADQNRSAEDNLVSTVEAIYTGKITLEGLKLHDYTKDPLAPQKTAAELVRTCGSLAFIDPKDRKETLEKKGIPDNVAREYEKKNDVDEYHKLDDQYPAEMVEVWGRYKDETENLNNIPSDKPSRYLNFKNLEKPLENTKNFQRSPDEKTKKEDDMLKDYMGFLRDKSIETAKSDIQTMVGNVAPQAMDKDQMARTIAAHLCSAYYGLDQGEGNNKDLIVFDHEVSKPVNDRTIKDTIKYFKEEVYPEIDKNTITGKENVFSNLNSEQNVNLIKTYYDAAILNREAKAVMKNKGLDSFSAYINAMNEKLTCSGGDGLGSGAALIGEMKGTSDKIYGPWENYVINMIDHNKDFSKAIAAHLDDLNNSKGLNYSPRDLARHFVSEFKKATFSEPDVKAHNEKINDLNDIPPTHEDRDEIFQQRRETLAEQIKDAVPKSLYKSEPNWAAKWAKLQAEYKKADGSRLVDLSQGEESYQAFMNKPETKAELEKLGKMEKEAVQTAKKQDNDFSEQFNDIAETIQGVRSDVTKPAVLDALVKGVGGSDDPQKARKNLLALAKNAKRNFLKVIFHVDENLTSTDLRNGLNKLANLKEGETMSPEEVKNLRKKALELKGIIAQGRKDSEDEKWFKKLSGLDQARYRMAATVLKNTDAMMKKENNGIFKRDVEKFETKKDNKEIDVKNDNKKPEVKNEPAAAKKRKA